MNYTEWKAAVLENLFQRGLIPVDVLEEDFLAAWGQCEPDAFCDNMCRGDFTFLQLVDVENNLWVFSTLVP